MMAGGLVLLFGVDRSLLLIIALSQVAAGSAEVMGRFGVVATAAAAATLFVGLRTLGTTSTTTTTSSSTTTAATTSATSTTTTTTTTATTHRTGRTEEAWRLGSRLVNVEGREHVHKPILIDHALVLLCTSATTATAAAATTTTSTTTTTAATTTSTATAR
uniref:Uncharacterized protein n=1 Tax=Anopheles coluzzii TaxID=1518534 RepID=A0A8W7PDE1_ANOCL